MRNIKPIRTEHDLAVAVAETLPSDKDLSWRVIPAESLADKTRADAVVHLKIGGKDISFLAEFKLKPTADLIETLGHRASPRDHPWLLVTPRLSERFVELCRKSGVACLDLNGRVWIRRGSVLVDRSPQAGRESIIATPPEPDLVANKSSRVLRALLSPQRQWNQAELAKATGVSRPLLSRLLETLRQQGYVRREGNPRGGTWILAQADALLDEWARRDAWSRRTVVQQFSILVPTLEAAATQLSTAFRSSRFAFTQWYAAQLRHPYTESPVLSVYVDEIPSADLLKSLNAREVVSGGRLWLIRPRDEGVFQFTQTVDGLPLVSDAQIYLDLLQVGQRGPDAADALRYWENFRL
jgi:DNA-binding transcriptional ArsR family regulator